MIGLKLEYEIDNFSGLIEISHENLPTGQKKGIYFFYNENKELLYIGKMQSCIRQRLISHLFKEFTGIVEAENYDNRLTLEKRKHYKYFAYSEIPIQFIAMMEIFLIKKFNPIFNYQFNNGNYKPPKVEPTKLEIFEQEKRNEIYSTLILNPSGRN